MGAKLKGFQIEKGSPGFIIYVVIGLVAIIVIYLLYVIFKATIVKQGKIRKEWKRFYDIADRRRLTSPEIEFLKEVIKKYQIPRPVLIVRQMEVFNRYIFREMQERRGHESRTKENFKAFIGTLRKKLGFANFELLDELSSSRELREGVIVNTMVMIANIEKKFESKIAKVDEEGVILTVPDPVMAEEPLRENLPTEINVTIPEDAEYTFNSTIYKVIPGPPGYICIDHTRNFSRTQKRKYDRIDVDMAFKYFFLNDEQRQDFITRRKFVLEREIKYEAAVIKNLSGGGMYFDSEKDLEVGTIIAISFQISKDSDELKNIVGSVVRVLDNDDDTFRIFIHFVKIREPFRNQIIHYVHERKNALKRQKLMRLKKKKRLATA